MFQSWAMKDSILHVTPEFMRTAIFGYIASSWANRDVLPKNTTVAATVVAITAARSCFADALRLGISTAATDSARPNSAEQRKIPGSFLSSRKWRALDGSTFGNLASGLGRRKSFG